MDREEQWKKRCERAGTTPFDLDAKTGSPLKGAERILVAALLSEGYGSDDEETAVECIALAAAMVEQCGRVLGALRAAKAVEEALLDPKNALRQDGHVLNEVKGALREHGFGPWVKS